MPQRVDSYFINHVRKFLEEEFVIDSRSHVSISSLWKAYTLWCEARQIVNRRMTTVALLEHLERHHRIVARRCYSGTASVFALNGLRFRTGKLNERLRPKRNEDGYEGYSWRYRPARRRGTEEEVEAVE